MQTLLYIIIATSVVSLASFSGVLALVMKEKKLEKILLFIVALSAGALMGDAFLHLLPEASEEIEGEGVYLSVLASFIIFFLVEKVLHWRHCHKLHCDVHTFGHMNLFGDFIHNFIDGFVIAATFLIDFKLGFATTVAVALHEIPQEIGDMGVLLYSGFSKKKALFFNFLTALSAVLAGIIGYFASSILEGKMAYLLPFAAGGFIYIAASDLIPEIRKELDLKRSVLAFLMFMLGIMIMFAGTLLERN